MSDQASGTSNASDIFINVGDVVILVDAKGPYYIGQEFTVVRNLSWIQEANEQKPELLYVIEHPTDGKFVARPHWLRKKRPPRETFKVGRWDQCPWQPESINV